MSKLNVDQKIEIVRKMSLKSVSEADFQLRKVVKIGFLSSRDMMEHYVSNRDNWKETKNILLAEETTKLIECDSNIGKHDIFLAQKELEVDKAENYVIEVQKQLAEAKSELKKAQDILSAAQRFHSNLLNKKKKLQERVSETQKDVEMTEKIVLIHPSATVKQIAQYQLGYFISTYEDNKLLNFVTIDRYYYHTEDSVLIDKYPNGMRQRCSSEDEYKSIVAYCNMAANFVFENENEIVLLYSDKDIDDTLKMNGVI